MVPLVLTAPSRMATPLSALRSPLNAPRGITVDSFGNFSLADSGNSIARKLNSNIIFPSTPVGSQSATMPITFVVNQNVNLSAASGPDFSITSNTCNGATQPSSSRRSAQHLSDLHSLHSNSPRSSQRLSQISRFTLRQNHSSRPAGRCHRLTQCLYARHRQHHRQYAGRSCCGHG
jgi:hypothetical protein